MELTFQWEDKRQGKKWVMAIASNGDECCRNSNGNEPEGLSVGCGLTEFSQKQVLRQGFKYK